MYETSDLSMSTSFCEQYTEVRLLKFGLYFLVFDGVARVLRFDDYVDFVYIKQSNSDEALNCVVIERVDLNFLQR